MHKLNLGDLDDLDGRDGDYDHLFVHSRAREILDKIKYWCYYRLVPKHMYWLIRPRTLSIGYYDQDTRLLHGMMQCLVEFYEHEFNQNDWDWCESHRIAGNEIKEIYQYWMDRQTDDELDEDQYLKDNEMLHRLIDIRKYMWS